ncbi:NAD(P)-dependent alcohol dehydrogenase [Aurantiacibacter aquimixticola]|uniref:NAD(P)-dependent alcohol dehydrogenase n=1 Tax=Aurantiacibacter aquimixticola TaxID=1958945 RepID=A0A419RRG4_9SPHN|nr:NAD(P)-dependent alcohol dehydrogenase [Aurantiacibacter aquimixticola]RJY08367.1 NAD(P)-dependent alcohol dehydrogenase [Aurantiacibacter aquimixticola]
MQTIGYASHDTSGHMTPFDFERRDNLNANDVVIEITHCGICHSDLHFARNDWGMTTYPVVPGHEIVGKVMAVGSDVERHAAGDTVAVGCMVDSCQRCDQCRAGEEQFCREGMVMTYGSEDKHSDGMTHGGFSKHIVVREEFVLQVPGSIDPAKAAPLLCAGITTYSPMKRFGIDKGSRVAVIGLGGLGHMAVKIASAMGAHVTVLSRTPDKEKDAAALGADEFLLSSNEEAMEAKAFGFDLIVDTVPVAHDIDPYIPLLDIGGEIAIVGQVGPLNDPNAALLMFGRRKVSGSFIGGIPETQEMLEFCAEKGVVPEIEMIRMEEINEAFERLEKADVRYRFVIDMSSLEMPAG